jgi:hypothetical protein
MAEILNLDVIIPPKRYIKITERPKGPEKFNRFIPGFLRFKKRVRKIDVSLTSTRVTLEISKHYQKYLEASIAGEFDEVENEVYELIVAMCKPSFPEISREWIVDNTNPDQILAWFQFLIKPLYERAEAALKQKKAMAAQVN